MLALAVTAVALLIPAQPAHAYVGASPVIDMRGIGNCTADIAFFEPDGDVSILVEGAVVAGVGQIPNQIPEATRIVCDLRQGGTSQGGCGKTLQAPASACAALVPNVEFASFTLCTSVTVFYLDGTQAGPFTRCTKLG